MWKRTSLPSDKKERQLTEALCRIEFKSSLIFHLFLLSTGLVFIHIFSYIFPNDYHQTFNCYIFFLPPNESTFAWAVNFIYMQVTFIFVCLLFSSYAALPLILINQTCWLIDLALIKVNQMNRDLQPDDDTSDQERIKKTDDHLKKLLARCKKIVECRNEVQNLLYWNFNLEFQFQSVIICFTVYVLSLNFFASYLVQNICAVVLVQLYIYCWVGSRVTSRIDQLSYEVSKNWYLMHPKQRKNLQMILHWTQNINGFAGAFKDASLETFQSVNYI